MDDRRPGSAPAAAGLPSGSTGRRLARWSWQAFLVVLFASFLVQMGLGPMVADLLALPLALAGLLFAVLAFVRIPREGQKGILVPALVGLLLNGVIVVIWVTNFLAVRGRFAAP